MDRRAAPPPHVVRNVETLAEMQLESERRVDAHQRAIETGTALLGRPASLYLIIALVFVWMIGNALASRPIDPAPFSCLQGVVGLAGLLTTTMVLITQNRQAKLLERRMHLDLQVNLLTEQKTAKLIELLEELRRDLPDVPNRRDTEAEVLQQAAQPRDVLAVLEQNTLEASKDAGKKAR